MSSRIGSVASRPSLVRRTAPIGSSAVSVTSAMPQVSVEDHCPARRAPAAAGPGDASQAKLRAVLQVQTHRDDRDYPDSGDEQRQPVEVLLHDGGAGQAGLDATTEQASTDPPPLARCSSTSSTTSTLVTPARSAGPIPSAAHGWPNAGRCAGCPSYGSGPPAAIADSVANCSPSSDAPPTSAPSTSCCPTISPTFLALTEPP